MAVNHSKARIANIFFRLSVLISITLVLAVLTFPDVLLNGISSNLLFIGIMFLASMITALISGSLAVVYKRGKNALKKRLISLLIICVVLGAIFGGIHIHNENSFYTMTVDGIERQYKVHLPAGYSETSQYPVLFVLHGGSGSANQIQRAGGFDRVADDNGFITVYPDGLGLTNYIFHVWNSGYLKTGLSDANDTKFLYELVFQVNATYSVNSSEIYLTGHSNGGMMAYRIAAEYPNLFAAVSPVSGSIGGKGCPDCVFYTIPEPKSGVSIIHVHGRQDKNVPYEGGYAQSGFQKDTRWDISVNESVMWWVDKNNCDESPHISKSTSEHITLFEYTNGDNGSSVILVRIEEKDHMWHSMNTAVEEEKFYGDSLAEMIWNLMQNYAGI